MSLDSAHAPSMDTSRFSFGIVAARFNLKLVDALLARAYAELIRAGVKATRIRIERVPGSHEIPFAAHELALGRRTDCVLTLGVLIGGDTHHHQLVGESVSHALQQISILTRKPIVNGVIVADNLSQAEARTIGKINRGVEFAHAALEMAALRRRLRG
ncbi:MAG: 6,7-dimethyl-8-ribityllumazine synthase [Opitutaceae bacterium]|nr:6,7-dimethyl-8-ribityllumazine synthase [Opitutaceae bacterium]